jgi:hypothetical protein
MGRYSNGPLWVEYLSTHLGLEYDPERNFAESGDRTDQMLTKATAFAPTEDVSQALFVAWAGGNDLIQRYNELALNNAAWDAAMHAMAANVSNVVVRLYEQGARFVLVPNTVDVTDIPTFNVLPGFYRDYIRDWIEAYNARLLTALQVLGQERPELTVYHVDVYSRTKAMLGEAEAYGFTETEVGALQDPELEDKRFEGPGRSYVYWDIIHPTTKVHGIVADWFLSVVWPRVPEAGISRGDGGLTLMLSGMHAGGDYRIERTSDFEAWDVIGRLRGYGESAVEEPLAADGGRGFYRVIYER